VQTNTGDVIWMMPQLPRISTTARWVGVSASGLIVPYRVSSRCQAGCPAWDSGRARVGLGRSPRTKTTWVPRAHQVHRTVRTGPNWAPSEHVGWIECRRLGLGRPMKST